MEAGKAGNNFSGCIPRALSNVVRFSPYDGRSVGMRFCPEPTPTPSPTALPSPTATPSPTPFPPTATPTPHGISGEVTIADLERVVSFEAGSFGSFFFTASDLDPSRDYEVQIVVLDSFSFGFNSDCSLQVDVHPLLQGEDDRTNNHRAELFACDTPSQGRVVAKLYALNPRVLVNQYPSDGGTIAVRSVPPPTPVPPTIVATTVPTVASTPTPTPVAVVTPATPTPAGADWCGSDKDVVRIWGGDTCIGEWDRDLRSTRTWRFHASKGDRVTIRARSEEFTPAIGFVSPSVPGRDSFDTGYTKLTLDCLQDAGAYDFSVHDIARGGVHGDGVYRVSLKISRCDGMEDPEDQIREDPEDQIYKARDGFIDAHQRCIDIGDKCTDDPKVQRLVRNSNDLHSRGFAELVKDGSLDDLLERVEDAIRSLGLEDEYDSSREALAELVEGAYCGDVCLDLMPDGTYGIFYHIGHIGAGLVPGVAALADVRDYYHSVYECSHIAGGGRSEDCGVLNLLTNAASSYVSLRGGPSPKTFVYIARFVPEIFGSVLSLAAKNPKNPWRRYRH